MQVLDVYLGDHPRPAGALVSLDNRSTLFGYDDDYIATPDAVPLSLSLPLRPEPFGDVPTRVFFENLLPENDQMRRIIDLHGIDRDDFVSLLGHLGADCPGALSCVPEGSGPVKNPGVLAADYDELDLDTVAEFVRRMANGERLPDEARDPSPVAGYQQKMALVRLPNGAFALPKAGSGAPTTHILKTPQIPDRRDVERERAAAVLARSAGLRVVVPDIVILGDHPSVLLERYDRVVANGVVTRLHQEDFAQALGLPAFLKYERRGQGDRIFNAAGVAALLQHTATPVTAVREFLKLTVFNACVGNADNHAKNHSLLYTGGPAPGLAPAYDLLPTRLDPNLNPDMGFKIGAAARVETVTAEDMALLFTTFGFGEAAALRFAVNELAPLMLALDRGASDRDFVPKLLDDMIGANIEVMAAASGLDLDLRERDHFQHVGGGWANGS
ncbi:MAG: HipA domain-containing protein [Pseudomonadota bacterium]